MPMLPEVAIFMRFITSSVNHILTCLDGLSEEDLNWHPLENANSLYVLATHTLGNVEENLLGVLCGQHVHRQRESEFAVRGDSSETLKRRWHELQERIASALAQLPATELDRARDHPRRGHLTGREVLLVVARHAAEHMGQAELTRDLLYAARNRTLPPRKY